MENLVQCPVGLSPQSGVHPSACAPLIGAWADESKILDRLEAGWANTLVSPPGDTGGLSQKSDLVLPTQILLTTVDTFFWTLTLLMFQSGYLSESSLSFVSGRSHRSDPSVRKV